MTTIKSGDRVKHKHLLLNGGLAMNVLEVSENKAYCDFFDGPDQINKQDWFDFDDLDIIESVNGGFRNEGE